MTGNDLSHSDFSTLDAGKLLPGCSIPIPTTAAVNGQAADVAMVHAFRQFQPLPIDGLSRNAKNALADSMVDVARSLNQLHQANRCFGRITSTAFHNRGTASAPAATLWIDPQRAGETDTVHQGDPEAMYWTEDRLQTGRAATPTDDWYALGIVLAEITLSSAAVHKIWELSRQDGRFVQRLIKNLRRARGDRRMKSMATALIQQSAAGKIDEATIDRVTESQVAPYRKAVLAMIVAVPVALMVGAINLYQTAVERSMQQQQIVALTSQTEELQNRVEELQQVRSLPPAAPVAASVPQASDAAASDRRRWASEYAGRSLEQATASSESFQPSQWRERLIELQSLPGQKQWRMMDEKLRRLIQLVVDAPWDAHRFNDALERITALGDAHARWTAWARSSKSVDEIRTQHELMPSGLVKELLGQWLAEALEIRSFDIRARISQAAEDNAFVAHVIGFSTPADSESIDWTWASADGSGESIEMQVDDYRAGDPLTFWLKQDSAIPYWDSTVIQHQFESPLIVWQLAKGLKLEDSESGYGVVLATTKRFGPPVILQAGAVENAVATEPQIVDPMKELPFGLD